MRELTWDSGNEIYNCKCGCEMPEIVDDRLWLLDGYLWDILCALEEARPGRGLKLFVTSGYRCKKYNSKVGGAKNSQHKLGYASDIVVKFSETNRSMSPKRVFEVVESMQENGVVPPGGLHAYKGFTHVDIRGKKARW